MTTKTKLQLLPQYAQTTIEMIEKRRQHWYKVSGHDELLPSVTTCLKIIDKSGPLMGWAKNVMADKFRSELIEENSQGKFPTKEAWVDAVVIRAKKRPDQERDEAADAGTTAHGLIADIIEGGKPSVPEVLTPAVQGAMEFLSDYNLTVEAVEQRVWHPVYGYAGTVDCIARDPDGRLIVIDWKRAKALYPEYAYQVAAYADAVEALTGELILAAYVVRLPRSRDEGLRYECKCVHSIDDAFATYVLAQDLWASVKNKDSVWA